MNTEPETKSVVDDAVDVVGTFVGCCYAPMYIFIAFMFVSFLIGSCSAPN